MEIELLEKERLEKERLEKERFEKERLEKERLEKELLEKERLEIDLTLINFIVNNKIKQIVVSESINNVKNDMKQLGETEYKSLHKNTIFYGVYTTRDINNIQRHIGNKWILWGGNDCAPNNPRRVKVVEYCKNINIKQFLCVTSNVNNNLNILNIDHLYLDGTHKNKKEEVSIETIKITSAPIAKDIIVCTEQNSSLVKDIIVENKLLHKFMDDNKISQIVISESLKEGELHKYSRILARDMYDTSPDLVRLENTLFYGVYTLEDMMKIKKHKGKKWILWAGNDCNITNNKRIQMIFNCLKYNVEYYLSLSKKVNEYLSTLKINFLYLNYSTHEIEEYKFKNINLNLNKETKSKVENTLFKNIPVYVLNLKKRLDRYNFMKFKLNDIGIYNYEVFDAIDANNSEEVDTMYNKYKKTISDDDYLKKDILYISKKSAFAILLSYKKLIKNILDTHNNLDDHILILEDDISFHNDIETFNLDYDKDVIYLGANQLNWLNRDNSDYELINNEKYITYGAYGILYKLSFLENFYNSVLMLECRKPYDYLLWKFIVSNNISNKVILPNLILPNINDSDNMGKRNIFKICKKKKWNINLYKYILLELEFYNFYKEAYKFKSFRMLDKCYNGIHSKDISRIIEGNYKAFVFIIASYNNESYYKKNLDSILKQTYKLWRIIYIDDYSTDNTYNLVNNYRKINQLENNFILLKNKQNMKQAYSRYQAYKYCDDDEVICFLDGDDWLYDNKVLENLNREYQNDIKLTYGSYYKYENNENKTFVKSKPYEENVIMHKLYRKMKGWYGIPLRTGYASLYKSMPKSYLLDNDGNWMSACTDVAEFLWGIEKSEGKFKNIEYPTYVYNIDASKRFKNSMYNLSNLQLKYRVNTSEKIFNYEN